MFLPQVGKKTTGIKFWQSNRSTNCFSYESADSSVFQLTERRLKSPTTMIFISLYSSLSRQQKKELNSSIVTRYLLLLGGLYKHKISTFSSLTVMHELANADVSLSFRFVTSIGKEVMLFRPPNITPPCLLYRFAFFCFCKADNFAGKVHYR